MPGFQGKMRLTANPFDLVGADIEVSDGNLALIVSDQEIGEWPLHTVAIAAEIDGFHMQVDGEEFVFSTRDADAFAEAVGISLFGARAKKQGRSAKAVKAIKASGLVQPQSAGDPTKVSRPKRGLATRPTPQSPMNKLAAPTSSADQAAGQKSPGSRPMPPRASRQQLGPLLTGRLQRVRSALAMSRVTMIRRLIALATIVVVVSLGIVARPLLAGLLLFAGMAGSLLAGAAALDPLLATRLPERVSVGKLTMAAVAAIVTGLVLLGF